MPVLDTPITTDQRNLKKVLGQKQPALLYLHDGQADKPLDDALRKIAKKHAGDLLVVRVDANENPDVHAKYDRMNLPALVTLSKARFGRDIQSRAENIRPADLRAHVDHLLTGKPLPQSAPKASARDSASHKPIHVSDANFRQEVLKSKQPVLVDFWAPWCAPCRSIAPYIDKIAGDYEGQLKVAKLNVDDNPVMARRFQVQSIPTFIVFEGGQPVTRTAGASPANINGLIKQVLG